MTPALDRTESRLRLDTLLELRWCSLGAQTLAILIASVGFDLPFNYRLCLVIVAIGGITNIVLKQAQPARNQVRVTDATLILVFDILALSAIIFMTGGLSNPLVILYAVPVLVAAAALPSTVTFGLGMFTLFVSCALIFVYRPLPWQAERVSDTAILQDTSIWGALAFTIGLCALFTSRIGSESQKTAEGLLAVERVLERQKRLTQLDGLAAAAAHELGTPLATIALVANELRNELPAQSHIQEDLNLLRGQVERCRQILTKLAVIGSEEDDFLSRVTIDHLIHEISAHQTAIGRHFEFSKFGEGDEPVIVKNAAMLYSLTNLIDNAADYAVEKVSVRATWSADVVALEIKDDGPGFAAGVLDRIGEPYLNHGQVERRERRSGASGLGIGLFISKTLIERSGARIVFTNARGPETGAITRVIWPRKAISPAQ